MNLRKSLSVPAGLVAALALLIAIQIVPRDGARNESILPKLSSDDCTVVMVGKDASFDGSTMITHAADCLRCDFTWRHVPAADHKPGEMRKIYHISQHAKWPPGEEQYTGVDIPQVPHTFAYHQGLFGYMNEHQLAIAESTIGTRPKMMNETPAPAFTTIMLSVIAMERCKTAREAIKLMGSLAEKYGYGFYDTGEMLAVADPNEVWVFEIMPVGPLWTPGSKNQGAIWCAQRLADDHVSVCPNESRIGEIDLKNPDYFMASSNVISFAEENAYYKPESGESFNWKKAYCPSEGSAISSRGGMSRLWRFFDLAAPSRSISPDTPNMELPFSMKPDKKLSAQDIMRITRDKSQGSRFDPLKGLQGGPFGNPNYLPYEFKAGTKNYSTTRTISVNRSEYTTLAQCRGWLPDPIGGTIWIAFGALDTSCYIPFYAGITELPDSFRVGEHWEFNRKSARWAFDYVDFHTQVAYSYAIEEVKKVQLKWEGVVLNERPAIDKIAQELYRQDPSLAITFLTDYCINNAKKIVDAWWDLGDRLLVKYNHLHIYDADKKKVDPMIYPEWWLNEVIEFDKMEALEQKEK